MVRKAAIVQLVFLDRTDREVNSGQKQGVVKAFLSCLSVIVYRYLVSLCVVGYADYAPNFQKKKKRKKNDVVPVYAVASKLV